VTSKQTAIRERLSASGLPHAVPGPSYVNIGKTERFASMIGGGTLTLYGLSRISLKGVGLALLGGGLVYRGMSGHSYLYRALGITTVEESPSTVWNLPDHSGIRVKRAVTINRSPEDLYRFWHNVENTPRFMKQIASVQARGDGRSHWVAKMTAGTSLEWDAEITDDQENRLIAWRTLGKTTTATAGSVRFTPAPDGRGTVVTLELDYPQFAGEAGVAIGKIFGKVPEQAVREDLRHFKEVMEAGEIPTAEGQPSGRRGVVKELKTAVQAQLSARR